MLDVLTVLVAFAMVLSGFLTVAMTTHDWLVTRPVFRDPVLSVVATTYGLALFVAGVYLPLWAGVL